MQVTSRNARHTENPGGGGSPDGRPDEAWGVTATEAKDIPPGGPEERRRRNRLHALRAMDRPGASGEEGLIAAPAARPDLGWLVEEEGPRWGMLTELGHIRQRERFEAAVEWVLSTRPRTEQARACIRRFGAGTTGTPNVDAKADRLPPNRVGPSGPRPPLAEARGYQSRRLGTRNHQREGGEIMLRDNSGFIVFAVALLLAMAALYSLIV